MSTREIQYGDVISVNRGPYKHFGIYSGNGKIIHYTDHGSSSAMIQETSLSIFMDGADQCYVCDFNESGERTGERTGRVPTSYIASGAVGAFVGGPIGVLGGLALTKLYRYIRDSDSKLYSPEETVQRARSRLGQGGYNFFLNNCEHFAIWCKTGIEKSEQLDELVDTLIWIPIAPNIRIPI